MKYFCAQTCQAAISQLGSARRDFGLCSGVCLGSMCRTGGVPRIGLGRRLETSETGMRSIPSAKSSSGGKYFLIFS